MLFSLPTLSFWAPLEKAYTRICSIFRCSFFYACSAYQFVSLWQWLYIIDKILEKTKRPTKQIGLSFQFQFDCPAYNTSNSALSIRIESLPGF